MVCPMAVDQCSNMFVMTFSVFTESCQGFTISGITIKKIQRVSRNFCALA
jgi:hypothetical protein